MKKIFFIFYCMTALGLAQIKISDLPELKTVPDSSDLLVIVDRSADTTKAISKGMLIKQLLDSIQTLRGLNNALFDSIAVLRNLIGLEVHPIQGIFVDSENGNDDSSGYTETAAIKTLAKLNSLDFDTILTRNIYLKKNSFFLSYLIPQHDSLNYSSYGIGNKPIITLRQKLNTTWTNWDDSTWFSDNLYANRPILRLWIDGIEQIPGIDWIGGDNLDGTYGINSVHRFHHEWGITNSVYIYSLNDPNNEYDSIEVAGDFAGVDYHTVFINGYDYINLNNLDLQGGTFSSLAFSNTNYDTVRNCNIGKYSNWCGVVGNYYYTKDATVNGIVIEDCDVISDWDYKLIFYTAWTPYGFYVGDNTTNWVIQNNYVENWWFGIYLGQGPDGYSIYHDVINNEVTSPLFTGGKGIQTHAFDNPDYGFDQYALIYNNYIHDIPAAGINIGSRLNKIYFNIIDSIFSGTNSHVVGNNGLGIEVYSEDAGNDRDSNYIFNNTFYKTDYEQLNYANKEFIYNNLFLEMRQATVQSRTIYQYNLSNCHYKNNLFYQTGSDSGSYFISFYENTPHDIYSVNMFNALGGNVSGNIYPDGFTTYQIINYGFTLPLGSPGKNSGINISGLVPIGFRDRLGNLVNIASPNLGAIDD